MPNSARATVVIAAWNAESTIVRAIDSALSQSLPVEVVVVDDASTDATAQVVEDRAQHDARLVLLKQSRNQGPAAARNRAIQESDAPWISVLDADDIMAPDRLRQLVERAEAEGLDFLADDIEKVSEADTDGPRTRLWSDDDIGEIDIDAATFIAANVSSRRAGQRREMGFLKPVMRREFLNRHKLRYANLRLGEDYELYARSLILGARFRLTDPRGYIAVVRPSSLSGNHPTEAHAEMMAADRALLELPQLDGAAKAALQEHLLEEHKKWVWRRMIDAGRRRDPIAMAACFRAPLPVAVDLAGRLGGDILSRLPGRNRPM